MRLKRWLFWLTAPLFLLAVMTGTGFLLLIRPTPRSRTRAAATRLKE
jgi:hypothetical protein